jgi:hypothetical protein
MTPDLGGIASLINVLWPSGPSTFSNSNVDWEGQNPTNVHTGSGGETRGTTDLPGGDAAAREKFAELVGRPPSGSRDIAQLPDGTYVTYRGTSSSGTPAVSINHPGVKYETIHFKQ